MDKIELDEYPFRGICRIAPELNESGHPIEYAPQSEYKNARNLPLNKYGGGTFCRFRIPSGITEAGVYAVLVNGTVKYVGECGNLSFRWNVGYGNISPRNCFVGGQYTNCRINKLILDTYKSGSNIDLYFHQTENRFKVESKLIEELCPEWNIKKIEKSQQQRQRNKYQALTDYLLNSQKLIEHLTYGEIEGILGTQLPNSAYNFNAWWSNTGHKHAKTWTNAGFKATSIKLGKSVKFRRVN